ncbi:hypothetical protein GPALN_010190 [Globodera pallida]|nr:hypothetical protein GPALN_010190 [Globodera pallida]
MKFNLFATLLCAVLIVLLNIVLSDGIPILGAIGIFKFHPNNGQAVSGHHSSAEVSDLGAGWQVVAYAFKH